MKELTLIIPAKNEAESLPIVLDELKKYNYKINIVLHITDIDTIQVILSTTSMQLIVYYYYYCRSRSCCNIKYQQEDPLLCWLLQLACRRPDLFWRVEEIWRVSSPEKTKKSKIKNPNKKQEH